MHHVGEPAVANVAANKNLIYALSTMGTTSPAELCTIEATFSFPE